MDVTTRIKQADLLLPNPALMSASTNTISHIVTLLEPVIMDERIIRFITHIRQQDLRTELLRIFWNSKDQANLDANLDDRTYLTIISFLIASPGTANKDMMDMINEIDRIFTTSHEDDIKAEAADLMHRFFPERGEIMLNELRHILNIENLYIYGTNELNRITMNGRQQRVLTPEQDALMQFQRRVAQGRHFNRILIYEDLQNVHNTTINESMISAARALIEEMVATVTFDGRYKFNVFKDDTVKSITYRLANILKKSPKDITIMGDNNQQKLQPRMTYKVAENAESTVKISFFNPENIDKYLEVMNLEDYIFPPNIIREGELGQQLEQIFIVTNHYLIDVFENKAEEEFLFYLDLCGIPSAELIWFERENIIKDLHTVIGNDFENEEDINDFLDDVFEDLFLDKEDVRLVMNRIKTDSVRDIKLLELLNAVWKFIYTKKGAVFSEMKKRLREELIEGMYVCTSGLCAHMVSVIQGYFDEDSHPNLKIKMSPIDALEAKLAQNINQLSIKNDVDPVVDRDDFKKMIDKYIEKNGNDLLSEFTDHDIRVNGLSKQVISDMVYKIYDVKN